MQPFHISIFSASMQARVLTCTPAFRALSRVFISTGRSLQCFLFWTFLEWSSSIGWQRKQSCPGRVATRHARGTFVYMCTWHTWIARVMAFSDDVVTVAAMSLRYLPPSVLKLKKTLNKRGSVGASKKWKFFWNDSGNQRVVQIFSL